MIKTTEPIAGEPRQITLDEIIECCADLERLRSKGQKVMAVVEKKQQAVLDEHKKELDQIAHELDLARIELELRVVYGRQFFLKPKTQVFHGIEVGYVKERDTLEVPPDNILIPRIKTLLKTKISVLIRTVESVVKEAFKQLTVDEKQKLGCRIIRGADKVVVRAQAQSDVEKYFAARLTAAAAPKPDLATAGGDPKRN